jgi:hypothetical protein
MILRISSGSRITETTDIRAPHFGQLKISISHTLASNRAHALRRIGLVPISAVPPFGRPQCQGRPPFPGAARSRGIHAVASHQVLTFGRNVERYSRDEIQAGEIPGFAAKMSPLRRVQRPIVFEIYSKTLGQGKDELAVG